MPITINGSGTVTGISAGGLPDDCIVTADIADNNVTTAKIANIGVTEIKIADNNVTTSKIADANITPAKLAQPLTLETAKAWNWNGLTTNTSLDFTSIPSWVKRVTVMFSGVSTNGTSQKLVRVGAGSIVTTGYTGNSSFIAASSVGTLAYTDGFNFYNLIAAADVVNGHLVLTNVSGNVWACSAAVGNSAGTVQAFATGSVTLSGTLDRVRITTVNGTDTFDAGTINIMYE